MGWGCIFSPQGRAIFHVGYEEECDNYAVIYLDRKTGIVLQSVNTKIRGIAPGIAKELIGAVYSSAYLTLQTLNRSAANRLVQSSSLKVFRVMSKAQYCRYSPVPARSGVLTSKVTWSMDLKVL